MSRREYDDASEVLTILTTENKLKDARRTGNAADVQRLERRIDDSLEALGKSDKYKGSDYGH